MRLKQFKHLLDLHGADLQRWPAAERRAARALLARDGRAQRTHDEAAALDKLLGAYDPPPAAGAAARVAAKLAVLPPRAPDWRAQLAEFWWDLRALPRVPTMVAVLLLGFVAGMVSVDLVRVSGGRADLSALLFEPSPSDWLQL